MNPVILPSNDAYVNVFPKLLASKPLQQTGKGKSILSGKVFESAEPMSNKNELFNTTGYFTTPHHGKSR
jgi:hypothetical protein